LSVFNDFLRRPSAETTSFDGKPFLTPAQFGFLSLIIPPTLPKMIESYELDPNILKCNHSFLPHKQQMRNVREGRNNIAKNFNSNKRSYEEFIRSNKKNIETEDDVISIKSSDSEDELNTQCPATIITKGSNISDQNNKKKLSKMLDNNQTVYLNIQKEEMNIVSIWFDPNKKTFMYKVECKFNDQVKRHRYLTRQEILKEDPMLLIYFYEKHIEFNKEKFHFKKLISCIE